MALSGRYNDHELIINVCLSAYFSAISSILYYLNLAHDAVKQIEINTGNILREINHKAVSTTSAAII